jgi:ribonuclease P protein component
MAKEAGFGKPEKLKSRKVVEELFARGKSQSIFPIRISYKFLKLEAEEKAIMQAGVSVSKRNFKSAVDRNRIKRLLREAYRLQKKELVVVLKEQQKKGYAFFIYTGKELPAYQIVFDTMTKCLDVLKRKVVINEDRS